MEEYNVQNANDVNATATADDVIRCRTEPEARTAAAILPPHSESSSIQRA